MSDFATLAYLDGRQLRNSLIDIARKPQRLILYVLAAAYFVMLAWTRTLSHQQTVPGVADPWATLLALGIVFLGAMAILRAAAGSVAAFSSAADARFLIGSRLSERNVAVWLQLRNSARMLVRLLFLILLYSLLYHGAGRPLAIALTMTCLIIGGIALGIPVFKLRQHIGQKPCTIAAITLATLAIAGMTLTGVAWLDPRFSNLQPAIDAIGLGHVVAQALLGNATILGIGFAIDAVLIGLAYFGATDIYPELNLGSARYLQALARGRRGVFANLGQRSKNASTSVASMDAPAGFTGAASLLWKDWVSSRRTLLGHWGLWLMLAGSLIVGIVLAIFSRSGHEARVEAFSFGGSIGFMIIAIGALTSSVSLAADIGKPLWWLSDSTVRQRLYAWTTASSWRIIAVAALGLLAWSFFSGTPAIATIGLPLAILLAFFVRAVGIALYSLFPSALDQRGPVAMIRMLGVYVSIVPPVAAVGAAFFFIHHTHHWAEPIAGGLVAILELAALIEFAAWRIQTRGVAIAQAEAA